MGIVHLDDSEATYYPSTMTKHFLLPILALIFCAACHNEEPEAVTRGRVHYEQFCGLCHGANGEGYLSPRANALNNPEFLKSASNEFLYMAITQGRPGTQMSPFGNEFASMMRTTSLLSVISFEELLRVTRIAINETYSVMELYAVAATYYLIMYTAWILLQQYLEKLASKGTQPKSGENKSFA